MKYILLMAPEEYRIVNDYLSRPIRIIDNTTAGGHKVAMTLVQEGWIYVGDIESGLKIAGLKNGLEAEREKQYLQLKRSVNESLNLLLNALK